VTVIDASDPDWWRGKCLGQIGFFPSKYVAKLAPNEKPLQVTHNLQLGGNDDGTDSDPNRLTKLLRDQVHNNLNIKSLKYSLSPISLLYGRLWYKLEKSWTGWSPFAMAKIKQDPAQLNIYKKSELETNSIDDCELRLHTESEFSLSL
jgi:hypothetical protein